MPEIAEVETVRKILKTQILNKKIVKVDVIYDKIIETNKIKFASSLINQKIIDIDRKGKWLIFELDNYYLLSHLRMEGKFFLKNSHDPILKHEHIIFTFSDNESLRYHDTRKFGKMQLISKDELLTNPSLQKQGPEPNSTDLTKEYLLSKLQNKNIAIKTLLLDQTIISGLGNIYANEVLFDAKINPLKSGKEIMLEECQKLVESTNKIINKAISMGGTTIKSYTSSLGVTGLFQQELKVHLKDKELCQVCQNSITKIKINGRSTYYCSICQKNK